MKLFAKLGDTLLAGGCALVLACLLLFGGDATASTSNKTGHKSNSKTSASAKSTSSKSRSKSRRSRRLRKTSWRRGQQRIDSDRAREIQQALIREGYLHGSASGTWDQTSQRAMEKFQADNGWQTKVVPDSRALIKLGLGPNHDHLLNPDSAMTGPISRTSARSETPATTPVTPVAAGASAAAPQQ